jgi:hypothetical protein
MPGQNNEVQGTSGANGLAEKVIYPGDWAEAHVHPDNAHGY